MNIIKSIVMCSVLAYSFAGISGEKITQSSSQNFHAPKATVAEKKMPFKDVPLLKSAFINPSPELKKDNIQTGELKLDDNKEQMILELAKEIANGQHGKFDSLLISHRGKLVFESYFMRGRINLPHFQASATKAYTSLAVGRAIELGYLTMADLDKPLIHFLKGLNTNTLVKGAELITLHKALTMRSGIRLSDTQRAKMIEKPSMIKGQKEVQAYLTHSQPISLASQTFKYQYDPILVMHVLDAVVPGTAEEFIKKELLSKLGINDYTWHMSTSGLPESGSGTSISSRDMLKWGALVANKGYWNGEQLISKEYLTRATSRILFTGDEDIHFGGKNTSNQGYGYYFWGVDMIHGNKTYHSISAQGGGGQIINLIEDLDLIIVMTAHTNDTNYQQITAQRILPAFIKK
jgi:CubicO group peptidase (beta-lactamase class C family)